MTDQTDQEVEDFRSYLRQRRASDQTVRSYSGDLFQYLCISGRRDPRLIDKEGARKYLKTLAANYGKRTVARKVSAVRRFYASIRVTSPVEPVSVERGRVSSVLSTEDVDRLLSAPSPKGLQGTRDRALMGVMYWAGLKVSEVCSLDFTDVQGDKIYVRSREISIGPEMRSRIFRCREESKLCGSPALFVNRFGERIQPRSCCSILKKHLRQFDFKITANTLRHSRAHHMKEAGYTLPEIQRFLGLSNLATAVDMLR